MNSNTLSNQAPVNGQGPWQWLLRISGLEAWFQQAPAEARTGQQERVFLLLALPASSLHPMVTQAGFLAKALRDCEPALLAGGGEVVSQQGATLLLAWPATAATQVPQALNTYYQLRKALQQAGYLGPNLCGAASIDWVAVSAASTRYKGKVTGSVAGILHEAERLSGGLLIAAALHHRLAPSVPFEYELHVGFKVPGHRYPATLYRVHATEAVPIA